MLKGLHLLIVFFLLTAATQLRAQTDTLQKNIPDFIEGRDTIVADSALVIYTDTIQQLSPVKARKPFFGFLKDSAGHHSPKKAMILSAVMPGMGQIYNKKYWKAPVVWVGFGAFAYFINQNTREYKRYKKAYLYRTDLDSTTVSEFPSAAPELIANERNVYRKWRDLSIILTVGWYALNIIDANVDAHLFQFNVQDDITLHWSPTFNMALSQPKPLTGGLSFTLTF